MGRFIEHVGNDLRVAVRSLLRAPILTLTILTTVGLGIGASTVIFAAIEAAYLRPLPYSDPDRLVRIFTDSPPNRFRLSMVDLLALEAQQTQFEKVAAYTDRSMTFSDGSAAALVRGRVVSWTYFDLLGIRPAMGPGFIERDARPGDPPAVMITQGFWRDRLGARSDVIGRPLRLDGADYRLAGVLPPLAGPLERGQEFFVAGQWTPPTRKGPFIYTVIARLPPGADRTAAVDELRAISRRIFPIWKSSYQDEKATWGAMDLAEFVVGNAGAVARLSLTAVALVWLIACANASSLLLARVTSRRRELAVRAALGASRGRVVRYLLAESAVLAGGAAIIGMVLARLGIGAVQAYGATYFPRTQEVALDGAVPGMMAVLTILSTAVFGLIPAVHGTGGAVGASLRSTSRSSTGSAGVRRLRSVLVGSQFAIATPLLVAGGLLLASLHQLGGVELGFDTRNVLTGSLRLPGAQYTSAGAVATYWDEFRRRVEALPGVAGVAFADGRPPNGVNDFNNFDLEDFPAASGQSQPVTPWLAVTPEYFGVLGLSLVEGRLLDPRDAQTEYLESVVVDRAWARRFFPNESAIGKRFKSGGCSECPWTSVVGVVTEVKYAGLDQPDAGTVYRPMGGGLIRFFILRAHTDPANLMPAVRQVIRNLDPGVALTAAATVDELVGQSLQQPQSLSILVGAFALVALILSIVGIYGVMAHYVQQHLKDISIRLALGSSTSSVLRLVVGHGMGVVAAGVAAGLLTALAVARLMSTLLFGVGAADVATFAGAAALLLLVALAACLVPAWRATVLQPAEILRRD
jgi:putative ABC transport system permease protein